jgi:hypothetical protein
MQFPLHLPCTSMGSSFECIEVANNRIVPQCMRMLSLAVSALAGTCNVVQASTAISICLV